MRRMIAGATAVSFAATPAVPDCESKLATELGTVYEVTDTRVGPAVRTDVKRHPSTAGRLRYMRVLLERTGDPPVDWRLVLREPGTGRVLQRFGPDQLPEGRPVWSDRLTQSEVVLTFELLNPFADAHNLQIAVTSYFVMPVAGEFHFYSAVDPDNPNWTDLRFASADEWKHAGDSVGMLIARGSGKASSCTGFAVGENLFLTNWHCGAVIVGDAALTEDFWDEPTVCDSLLIDFSWDGDAISDDFRCSAVLAHDRSLDYALIEIFSVEGAPSVRPVRLSEEIVAPGDPLTMIHHPLAFTKQISLDCVMDTAELYPSWDGLLGATEIYHLCDTEGGSSGAPLFSHNLEVFAMHRSGYDRNNETCLTTDDPRGRYNKAVSIAAILEHLETVGFVLNEHGHISSAGLRPD